MPSARELLEQADALMRRNRSRETLSPAMGPRTMTPAINTRLPAVAPGDFPVLTDAMETPPAMRVATAPAEAPPASSTAMPAASSAAAFATQPSSAATPVVPATAFAAPSPDGPAAAPHEPLIASPASTVQVTATEVTTTQETATQPSAETSRRAAVAHDLRALAEPQQKPAVAADEPRIAIDASRAAAKAFTDVPVLTDAIEEIDAALIAAAQEGEPSIWNDDAVRGDDSVLGPAPRSIAVIPESHSIDESRHRNAQAAAAESATASAVAASTAELIEEVRMQVLQRIDMFTDTGLRDQLGERLKPIVDKASAELVSTINQHVGELLRTYVAEAIERELDRLRNDLN